MPFLSGSGYLPIALGQWLESLRGAVTAAIPNAEVVDQRYVLARLLLVICEEFARADNGFALAMAQMDPAEAEGYWLRLIAYRLHAPEVPAGPSRGTAEVTGTPGTLFTGAEEAEDQTTGLRWVVGPGAIGVTGKATLPARCLVDGPNDGSATAADWKVKTELTGWSTIRLAGLTELGRLAMTEDELRALVLETLSSECATEYGDLTNLSKLTVTPGVSALRGFKTNRTSTDDENGIPGHHLEAVFQPGLPPEQVGQAMRRTVSSTAGTYGNRFVTIAGPYGPLTYLYSEGETMRVYARCTADTTGVANPDDVPEDLDAQLAQGLDDWSQTVGSGVRPTASDAETYLRGLFGKPAPFTDLEVEFSLDGVVWVSWLPVTIRQEPRINNSPTPAEIIGVVPGPYVFTGVDVLELNGVSLFFTGAETSLNDVIDLITGGAVPDLVALPSAENASATLILRSESVGSGAGITIGGATSANVVASLGLPAIPITVNGRDSDVQITVI